MCLTHPDILHTEIYGRPEAEVIGVCGVCGEKILDYDDHVICEFCEKPVHRRECMGEVGCKKCDCEEEREKENE